MVDDDDTVASAATVDDSVSGATDLSRALRTATATSTTVAAEGGSPPPPDLDHGHLRPGATVGRYEIVKMLGSGGMGMVYLAYDPTLDRPVALKLLRPELRGAQARLLREGQSVARLAHPNVVRVFDVGTDRDDLFIAMEYIDGVTLRSWLRAEKRAPRVIFELFAAAGRGLAAAHGAGLVHRDFKPDNVLVGRDGRVVVTDFGLARLDADDVTTPGADLRVLPLTMTLTRTGSLLGTPAYMAPEQLRGEVADARSDQFGFCVAHWEALFGARPFHLPDKPTLDDLRKAVEGGIVSPPGITSAMLPVERALRRGLSLAPADRFPDMDALLAALAPPRARDAMPMVAIDERIAHFRILQQLGQGGMGIVYRARDEKLGREVALKVLPGDVLARADRRERFLREARAAAAVVHPAIATVYEVGTDGDVPYIAMEYVAGRTLREVLARGPLEVVPLIRVAIPIADALARAHKAGVVHRDLKPENVMLDADGAPKILDFGVARVFDTTSVTQPAGAQETPISVVTSEGVVLGTPAYMSPEQARGRAVDGRSDLFAFGTMLFELLTGTAPFRGASTMDVATAIIRDNPPAPSTLAPRTPAELDRIVGKCLEKDPDDRYQDAAELVVDLRRLMRQTESGIAPVALVTQPIRARSRMRWMIPAAGIAIASAAATAAYVASRSSPTSPPAAPVPAPSHFVDRQLTAVASHDLDAGSLSPDGKTLALARAGRLMLQDVATGESRDLPAPSSKLAWVTWFPDGKRLLVGRQAGPNKLDLVITPIDGTATTTLPFHAWGALVSGRGDAVAMFDEGGLRITSLDGRRSRLLAGTREEAEFGWPTWSPSDRWIAYAIRGKDLRPAIRAVAADGSADVLLVDDPQLAGGTGLPTYQWLGDGRLLYVTHEGATSKVLAIDIDLDTGHRRGTPQTIATYPDEIGIENASRDGRRVLYGRSHSSYSHVRGALPRSGALTLRADDYPDAEEIGASADRKTTYYASPSGTARTEILAITDHHARALASMPGLVIDPRMTPDASSIVFLYAEDDQLSLRRLAVAGGDVAVVENLRYKPSTPLEYTEELVAQLACERAPARDCVLGVTEEGEQTFYVIDPDKGLGRRLGALPGPAPWSWDVSPDGTQLVVAHRQDDVAVIDAAAWRVRRTVHNPDVLAHDAAWIDSRSFLIAGGQVGTSMILRVDPDRGPSKMWQSSEEKGRRLRFFAGSEEVYFRTSTWARTFWLLDAE